MLCQPDVFSLPCAILAHVLYCGCSIVSKAVLPG